MTLERPAVGLATAAVALAVAMGAISAGQEAQRAPNWAEDCPATVAPTGDPAAVDHALDDLATRLHTLDPAEVTFTNAMPCAAAHTVLVYRLPGNDGSTGRSAPSPPTTAWASGSSTAATPWPNSAPS